MVESNNDKIACRGELAKSEAIIGLLVSPGRMLPLVSAAIITSLLMFSLTTFKEEQ